MIEWIVNLSPFFSVFLSIFIFVWACGNLFVLNPSGNSASSVDQSSVTVVSSQQSSEGLDLKLVPSLVKEAKDAAGLESKLNQSDGVNNLDLNDDGEVDYLKVEEFGQRDRGEYGFSITTEVEPGEVQEVATIELRKEGDQVKVATHGNQQIYGPGYGYSAFYGLSSVLMWSYILSPHGFYASPYRYGSYPPSYRPYRTASKSDYTARASRFERKASPTTTGPRVSSPNNAKTASKGIKRSLRNPTASQKSFRSRLGERGIASGGFGRKSQVTKRRSSFFGNRSVRNFNSSRRGFGGFGK